MLLNLNKIHCLILVKFSNMPLKLLVIAVKVKYAVNRFLTDLTDHISFYVALISISKILIKVN